MGNVLMTLDDRAQLEAALADDPAWQRRRARIEASERLPVRRRNLFDAALVAIAQQRGLWQPPPQTVRYNDAGIV